MAWFEIYVDEMPRAKKFYESVFEVSLEVLSTLTDTNMEILAFPSNMDEYGAAGALVKMNGFSAGGNSTLIYFACEDCAVEEARVESSGGQIQQS